MWTRAANEPVADGCSGAPVTIDWSRLAAPTGRVTVQLVRAGKVKQNLGKALTRGEATLTLPKLAARAWRVRLRYAGSSAYLPAAKVLPLRVRKAAR
jgi:hypothetical protein